MRRLCRPVTPEEIRMTTQYAGSCLCGTVRFAIAGSFTRFFLCHCSRCRKSTGSAHGANLFSSTARLDWLSGQDAISTFNVPNTRHTRSFCSTCGSALPYALGPRIVVPAGSLDSALALRPQAHIFLSSKASWDHDLHSVPGFDELPA